MFKTNRGRSIGMKTKGFIWGFSFLLTVGCGSMKANGPFEGEVDYLVTTPGSPESTVSYYIKEGKVRIEMDGKDGIAYVYDTKLNRIFSINPKEKTYTLTSLTPATTLGKFEGKVSRSGKTDTLLGRKCEAFVYENQYGKSEMWGDDVLYETMVKATQSAKTTVDFLTAIKSSGHFTLKTVSYDPMGAPTMTMTASKIEKKSLDDSLFQPPAGYAQDDPQAKAREMLKKMGIK
jgi:hypothetical protein